MSRPSPAERTKTAGLKHDSEVVPTCARRQRAVALGSADVCSEVECGKDSITLRTDGRVVI